MAAFKKVIMRELLICIRNRADNITPLLFFIIVASLFPLATTPNIKTLQTIGPGVIWVSALLATLLSLPKLFKDDFEDGSLETMLLSAQPTSLLIFAKVFAHWCLFGLPLLIVSPLIAFMYHLSAQAIFILFITLFIGTPLLSFLGAIIAALTVGLRNSGILLALILLPLYVPALIFATTAVLGVSLGLPVNGQLALLLAMLVLSMTLGPMTTAFALRIGVAFH